MSERKSLSPGCKAAERISAFLTKELTEFRLKLNKFGNPNKKQIYKILHALTTNLRYVSKWGSEIRVNLRHPDIAVRSVDRAFTSLSWNFENNSPQGKVGSAPPSMIKIIDTLQTLARFFEIDYPKWLTTSKEGKALVSSRISAENTVKFLGTMDNDNVATSVPDCVVKRDVEHYIKKRLPYMVHGSKKGGFPVTKEKRNRGKIVTVIRRVTGDQQLLLKELKTKLGCGGCLVKTHGTVNEEAFDVEIQGDSMDRVKTFLSKRGCLKGVSGTNRAKAEKLSNKKSNKSNKKIGNDKKICVNQNVPITLTMDAKVIKTMKPSALKIQLKARGLSTQGNRKDLIQRLQQFSIA